MTARKFERLHPELYVRLCFRPLGVGFYPYYEARAFLRSDGSLHAQALDHDPRRAIYELSQRCLKLAVREKADKQGWADANTGEVLPLSGHHVRARSNGGPHSAANIAAVGSETHRRQHEHRRRR